MKKIVLILVGGLLLGACGSEANEAADDSTDSSTETQTNASGDVVKDQIVGLIADVEKGMKPLSPIADVSNYDSSVEPYLVGENETGNYNSSWEDGDFKGSRFYSTKYNDKSQLGEVRMQILVIDDVRWDPETDEEDASKAIDYDKYKDVITEQVGSQPEVDEYSDGHVWKTATANWYLSAYDDFSLEFKMKEAK